MHEPSTHLRRLLSAISITPTHGAFVDVGTSYEMADGSIALSLGFRVLAVEARREAHAHVAMMKKREIRSGNLTLIHAALAQTSGLNVTIFKAREG